MDSDLQSGFASASLQVIFDKIATFAINEIGLILEVDNKLEELERTVGRIQAVVDLVESSQFNNKTWRFWLQDVRRMLYDADDLLDQINLKFVRVKSDVSDRNQVRNMILSSFNFSLAGEINKILEKLRGIAGEIESPIVMEMMRFKRHEIVAKRCGSSSLLDQSIVIERKEDKEKIMRLMFRDFGEENIVVIPIVGMAGIGKTMLAKVIYNDQSVVDTFVLRFWISVSVSSDVMEITKSIVESYLGKTMKSSNLDLIQLKLQEAIGGKKIFLVLDDMWDENPQNWDAIKLPFRAAAAGSRILVTTRSTFVSAMVSTTPPHNLQPLSDEGCWELMRQRAFSNRNAENVENLVLIGRLIAEKCEGIPLTANTLGDVLRLKLEEKQWDDMLKTRLWELPMVRNVVFSSVRLSFDQLSPNLKMCFAYCSIFPSNYEFEKEKLVHLWSAEGFVQAEGARGVEDIGRDYFDELLSRSFFYLSHKNGSQQHIYKMHGLIHKFAQLVSEDICFRLEDETWSLLPMCRHPRHSFLCFRRFQPAIWEVFHKFNGLRTFMVRTTKSDSLKIPYSLFTNLQCLRVLILSSTGLLDLPKSIEHLEHLRYLDVSQTLIERLPESTANVCGLHTLKLRDCTNLNQLPKNTTKMIELQHLDLDIRGQLTSMPPNFGKLTKLQTLSAFIVGKDEGSRIGELQNLKNIRGSFCITHLENVRNLKEAKTAMLDNKSHVEILELQWDKVTTKSLDNQAQQEVLAGLQPHHGIKELHIRNYSGIMFPDWLGDRSFSKLVTIYLLSCQYCSALPPLGQLPALEFLDISGMHQLISINHSIISGFPSLKSLRFSDMPKLVKWKGLTDTDMPHLCQLTIEECPRLRTIPSLLHLRSLEKLEFSKCPELQSLPEEPLPNSLEELIINNCDILAERCSNDGQDWNKIRNINRLEIDYNEILPPQQGS